MAAIRRRVAGRLVPIPGRVSKRARSAPPEFAAEGCQESRTLRSSRGCAAARPPALAPAPPTLAGAARVPALRGSASGTSGACREPPALPSEDFVEGGVELPPAPVKEDGTAGLPGGEGALPHPAQPLPSLEDGSLRDFWPSGGGSRALFLDYDGTLRDFEPRPELAVPTPELAALLDAIDAREDLVPHLVSGRDARFLETHFGSLSRFTLVAEQGFQIWRPGSTGWALWDHPDCQERGRGDWKAIARAEMAPFVRDVPGSHIEEKASSLVWHYRGASRDEAEAAGAAARLAQRLEAACERQLIPKTRISHGNRVIEVSCRTVRKGPVMRRLCEEKALFGEPFLSVLVAGDDVSDESMFGLAPHDFLTVKVGSGPTHARFRVESTSQLHKFLWQLVS